MDLIAAKLGAQMAINALEESGQIGGVATGEKLVVVPASTLDFEYNEEMGVFQAASAVQNWTEPLADLLLTVEFDGVTYNGKLVIIESIEAAGLGNKGLLGGEDTGEPFLILFGAAEGEAILIAGIITTLPGSHTIEVYHATETVKPMNPKYLPDTTKVLNLADYTVTLADGGYEVTLEAALMAAIMDALGSGTLWTALEFNTDIFHAADTDKPVVIEFAFGDNSIKIASPSIIYGTLYEGGENNSVVPVFMPTLISFTTVTLLSTTIVRVNAIIFPNNIFVALEPLDTAPSA